MPNLKIPEILIFVLRLNFVSRFLGQVELLYTEVVSGKLNFATQGNS